MKYCQVSEQLAESLPLNWVRANSHTLTGFVLAHTGEWEQGRDQMLIAESLFDDGPQIIRAKSSRALFEATTGMIARATKTLEEPLKAAARLGHTHVTAHCALAQAHILAAEGSKEKAVPMFEQIATQAYNGGIWLFGFSAEETLVPLYIEAGAVDLAKLTFASAQEKRAQAQLYMTDLDRHFLSPYMGAIQ